MNTNIERPSVVFGLSGDLGFQVFLQLLEVRTIRIVGLMVDRKTARRIDTLGLDLPCYVGNPRKSVFEDWWMTVVGRACYLFTVNYLFLLDDRGLSLPAIAALNIHGSLLPKYRGRTPHVWAIINGESESGITVHCIDTGCDTGDIVVQRRVAISEEMTGNDLLEKFLVEYPALILEALSLVNQRDFLGVRQNHNEATEFPKREPEDGGIDWDWSSSKIVNWIRAQAYPYPGAFSYCGRDKVIIDKCRSIDNRIMGSYRSGEIIRTHPCFTIATGSGAVELLDVREGVTSLEKGLVLDNEG